MNNLTRLLAEGVMEWEKKDLMQYVPEGRSVQGESIWWCEKETGDPVRPVGGHEGWDPLTDWNDCMMVVEQMEKDGFGWQIVKTGFSWAVADGKGICYASFLHPDFESAPVPIEENDTKRAICMAALKARGLIDDK